MLTKVKKIGTVISSCSCSALSVVLPYLLGVYDGGTTNDSNLLVFGFVIGISLLLSNYSHRLKKKQ